MPATFVPVPGVVKTVVEGNINGVPCNNVFYWLMDDLSGLDNAQATQVATGVHDAYSTSLGPWITSAYTLQQTTAEDLTSVSSGTGVHGASHAGSFGAQEIAASTATLVTHKIARRYRGGHPRTYLPPFSGLALADPQHWTSANVNGLQTAWGAFVSAAVATTVTGNTISQHVSVSFRSGNAPRAVPLIDPISSSIVETMVGTQRRRIGR